MNQKKKKTKTNEQVFVSVLNFGKREGGERVRVVWKANCEGNCMYSNIQL